MFRDAGSEKHPSSTKRETPASPARLATKGQNTGGDTTEGTFGRDHQGQGLSENINPAEAQVNPFTEAQQRAHGEYERLQEEYITKLSAAKRGEKGKIKKEYEAKLKEAKENWAKANREAQEAYSKAEREVVKTWGGEAGATWQNMTPVERRALIDARLKQNSVPDPFAVETPETFTPAPPLSEAAGTRLEDLGIDPQSGLSNEEMLARGLAAEGRVPEESLLALEENWAREASGIEKAKEVGNQLIECVLEAVD
jgi:hypothetical protein